MDEKEKVETSGADSAVDPNWKYVLLSGMEPASDYTALVRDADVVIDGRSMRVMKHRYAPNGRKATCEEIDIALEQLQAEVNDEFLRARIDKALVEEVLRAGVEINPQFIASDEESIEDYERWLNSPPGSMRVFISPDGKHTYEAGPDLPSKNQEPLLSYEESLSASATALEKLIEESGLTFSEFVEKMGSGNGGEVEKKESANATSQWGFWWALVAVILSVVGATWIGDQIAGTYGSLVCVGVWIYATWRAGNQ